MRRAARSALRAGGVATAGVLLLLGLVHLLWAALPERNGRPAIQPGPGATVAVAVAGGLFAAALTLLARLGIVWLPLPLWALRWGAWTLATLFGLRAVGEFQYVGLFKQVQGTAFARWDTQLYTPLCIAIAVGSVLVATYERAPDKPTGGGDARPQRAPERIQDLNPRSSS